MFLEYPRSYKRLPYDTGATVCIEIDSTEADELGTHMRNDEFLFDFVKAGGRNKSSAVSPFNIW
jgi:predicted aspartyl protease